MATNYRWEFGFDFNADPAFGTVSSAQAPGSPAAGEPIHLLQDGFCEVSGSSVVPAWPTSLEPGDTVEFFVYDLTSVQGTESGPLSINRDNSLSLFAVVDPHTGQPVTVFDGSPEPGLTQLANSTPSVWPTTVAVPTYQYLPNTGPTSSGSGQFTVSSSPPNYATLSVLLLVTTKGTDPSNCTPSTCKWFGLDPEMWVRDGG